MSRQLTFVLGAIVAGVLAGLFSTRLILSSVADKAPVVLAVFMAALFVRLARGVPTFPFEKISQHNAETVLESLRHLRAMYSHAFLSFMTALVISIAYTPLISTVKIDPLSSVLTGLLVASLTWAVSTAYLVYRTDISLFKAQTVAMQEVVSDLAATAAASSVETVRKSLRPGEPEVSAKVDLPPVPS